MCRGRSRCTELPDPNSWSVNAPLPPPDWIREHLPTFHEAVRITAAGKVDEGRRMLATIPSDRIREWCVEHGQMSGRFRVQGTGRITTDPSAPEPAKGPRNPSASMSRAVFERDGYRCRYCGLPVVPREVMIAFGNVVGEEHFGTGRANEERHGAALVSWAQVDHVVPFTQGGGTTMHNLVTACWSCNYGKDRYTLEQLGLSDPRDRPPVVDGWDGLTSLLSMLRARGRTSSRSHNGHALGGSDPRQSAGIAGASHAPQSRDVAPTTIRPVRHGSSRPKRRFPEIYALIRDELASGFPALEITNPNPTEWVYFGRFEAGLPGVRVRYRLPDHWAELVLKRSETDEATLRAVHSRNPLPGSAVAARGHSELVVWKATPPFDLGLGADAPRDVLRTALAIVDELRDWYTKNFAAIHA